ncbi:MAG: ribulose-phosphate 3-epimerase [Hydrogenibacillus schlegelii]|uniref:Ribulose-phosphate 3-epimerase n=1 Tax=Hydrogenibacillus schlegelii TaxID=1484 RepID=A0A947CUQ1_HYDSH|nr:ribulose-phosphate 3-epimerase [Hydrogenibacillus schlegelii]
MSGRSFGGEAVRIAPSILSADFGRLADEIRDVEAGGADLIHIDVMDGRFVPNITIGLPVVRAIRPVTRLPLDVHLMIVEPERYLVEFVAAGADIVSFHLEATPHAHRALQMIRAAGARAAVAITPQTPAEAVRHLIPDLDMVLVMTVNPGFGGQAFIPQMVDKVRTLRAMLDAAGRPDVAIEVDGGIDVETVPAIVAAGARVLVAGTAVFGARDRRAAIGTLRSAGEEAMKAAGGATER